MNKKGFTLVELLTVIVLIGLIAMIGIPNFMNINKESKEKSYDMLIKSIVESSQTYYEDCEYGDLSDSTKYGDYACKIEGNSINITLGTLANTGFLKVNKVEENSDAHTQSKKKVIDPRTNGDISDCKIKITKIITDIKDNNQIINKVVSYTIENNDSNSICPSSYK